MPIEVYIISIIFLGSLIYSTFGFGDALFSMPFLTLIIGIKTATPLMTMNGTTLALVLFIKHRNDIQWRAALKLLLASVCGIPFGIYFLKYGNENITKIILGLIITSVSVYNLYIKKDAITQIIPSFSVYFFGFIAGILGGAFNTGGPAVAIYGTLSGWTQLQFVSTLQGYFLPNDVFILIGQLSTGLLNKTVVYYYLICLPFLLLATIIGNKIRKMIPTAKFNRYLFGILMCVGLVFLLRALLQLQA